jgi:hypothetical protein
MAEIIPPLSRQTRSRMTAKNKLRAVFRRLRADGIRRCIIGILVACVPLGASAQTESAGSCAERRLFRSGPLRSANHRIRQRLDADPEAPARDPHRFDPRPGRFGSGALRMRTAPRPALPRAYALRLDTRRVGGRARKTLLRAGRDQQRRHPVHGDHLQAGYIQRHGHRGPGPDGGYAHRRRTEPPLLQQREESDLPRRGRRSRSGGDAVSGGRPPGERRARGAGRRVTEAFGDVWNLG